MEEKFLRIRLEMSLFSLTLDQLFGWASECQRQGPSLGASNAAACKSDDVFWWSCVPSLRNLEPVFSFWKFQNNMTSVIFFSFIMMDTQ